MQKWHGYNHYRRYKNADGSYTYTITVGGETVEVSRELFMEYASHARKMKYMELDLKRDRVRQDEYGRTVTDANGLPVLLPEREVSLERLMEDDWEFPVEAPGPDDDVLRRMEYDNLHRCLDLLTPDERALIDALFFEGMTEREYAEESGRHYMTIHSRKVRILDKLKKLLKS